MKVFIEKENKNVNINFKGSVKDLLKKLDINIETVLVICDDEILVESDVLSDDNIIKIISVVSGG